MPAVLFSVLSGLVFPSGALAQAGSTSVNIVVRDRSGAVPGLTASDFSLTDKGKAVTLLSATQTTTALPAPAQPVAANLFTNRLNQPVALPENVTVIVLDAANSGRAEWPRIRGEAIRALTSLPPDQRVAIFELDARLRVIWPINGDPARLRATLAHFAGSRKLTDLPDDVDPALARWLRDPSMNPCLTLRDCLDRTLPAMVSVSNHLRAIPGRRNLVWIARAFPFTFGHGGAEGVPELPQSDRHRYDARIQLAFESLTRANVSLYSVSFGKPAATGTEDNSRTAVLRAVPRTPPPVNFTVDSTENPLNTFAEDSGGRTFPGGDVRAAIRAAVEDAALAYTLTFPLPAPTDAGYHALKLQLTARRASSDVKIHAPAGYVPLPPVSPQTLAESVRDLLEGDPEATGIALTAGIERPSPSSLRTVYLINPADLGFRRQDNFWTTSLDIVYALKPEGKSRTVTSQSVPLRFTQEQYDQILKEGFTLTRTLETPAATADLRIVVADRNSGRLGSVTVSYR